MWHHRRIATENPSRCRSVARLKSKWCCLRQIAFQATSALAIWRKTLRALLWLTFSVKTRTTRCGHCQRSVHRKAICICALLQQQPAPLQLEKEPVQRAWSGLLVKELSFLSVIVIFPLGCQLPHSALYVAQDFEPPFKRQALQQDEADEYREAEPADEAADLEEPQEEQQHAEPELEEGEEAGDRVETAEDRAFIDDTEVAAEERYGSDGDDALVHHEEAEEVVEDELDAIFAKGKKKKAVRYIGCS